MRTRYLPLVLLFATITTGVFAVAETLGRFQFWKGAIHTEWVVIENYDRPPYGDSTYGVTKSMLVKVTENGVTKEEEWPVHDSAVSPKGSRRSVYYNRDMSEWSVPAGIPFWWKACVLDAVTVLFFFGAWKMKKATRHAGF